MKIEENELISYTDLETYLYYSKKKIKLFRKLCREAGLNMYIVNNEIELSDCRTLDEIKDYYITELSANEIWNSIKASLLNPTTSFQEEVFNRYINWLKKKNRERYLININNVQS